MCLKYTDMRPDNLASSLPSIQKLRMLLVLVFIAVCLLPATIFTIRQFEEARVILSDEALILSKLITREVGGATELNLSNARLEELAQDVLNKKTTLQLTTPAGSQLIAIEHALEAPNVSFTQSITAPQGNLGTITLTRSINDRLPIMIAVLVGALTVVTLGLYLLNTRVFRGWLRAEQADSISRKRFADIATVSSDWFWELDSQLKLSLTTLTKVAALSADNTLGKRLWEIPAIVPEDNWLTLKDDLSEQADFIFIYSIKDNAQTLWHELRGTPRYSDDGQFEGYRGAGRDITKERRSASEIAQLQEVVIHAMASLAETRDNETGNHIIRTKKYVRLLAEHLRHHPRFESLLTDDYIDQLYKSAPLHDIGKVGIKDEILCKPGKLTPEEFEIMKTHTTVGYDAIVRAEEALGVEIPFLQHAKDIALYHQEKWDGTGYPEGLAGDAIPFSARLMALADVYDALISERVYKRAFSHEEAIKLIKEGIGTHFDPDVGATFLVVHDQFQKIAKEFADE